MSQEWKRVFRNRMRQFEAGRLISADHEAISIKIRVLSGCYHREHSPHAFKIIDHHLFSIPPEDLTFSFLEHESGPEILVYLAVTTAGITLAKSVIDLIKTIIKARSEGIKKGDVARDPIELIIRRSCKGGEIDEEIVLRFAHHDAIDPNAIEKEICQSIAKVVKQTGDDNT